MTAPFALAGPRLETERLVLRLPDTRDVAAHLAFFASERSRFFAGPKAQGDAWRDFAGRVGHWALRGYGMFAIELKASGESIGLVGPVHPADYPEPELSWLLSDARHEGHGYAFEACGAVLDHLFGTLGWSSVVSYVDRENAASRALALRLGARLDPASRSPVAGCDVYRHHPEGSA